MVTLAKNAYGHVRRFWSLSKPLPEPERVFGKGRPMTGFLATLTDEQRKRALAYRGPDDHGDNAFSRKQKTDA